MMMMWLLGNNDGRVTSGPAAGWPVTPSECGSTLTRDIRRDAASRYFSHADVCYTHSTVLACVLALYQTQSRES